jgi:pyrroloquinoline quinone (PQQ) biosynthesis protein C
MEAERTARYPGWVQDLVNDTETAAARVAGHDVWRLMREGQIASFQHRHLLVGFWPFIERFPQFMALNLLKTSYGRSPAIDAARAWLARNLRQEQKHAEWFLDWAAAAGIPRDEMLDGWRPVEMTMIVDWCWHLGQSAELAEAIAATHYAVEGVTTLWRRATTSSVWRSTPPSRTPPPHPCRSRTRGGRSAASRSSSSWLKNGVGALRLQPGRRSGGAAGP